MPDYKERFRERFLQDFGAGLGEGWRDEEPDHKAILAFIEEELDRAENNGAKHGRRWGVNEERNRFRETIEAMCRDTSVINVGMTHKEVQAYNQALDDLLSKIRGEEKVRGISDVPVTVCDKLPHPGISEETECCERCKRVSWIDPAAGETVNYCDNANCPCHKPRTEFPVSGAARKSWPPLAYPPETPRTEETERACTAADAEFLSELDELEDVDIPFVEETEKERASFSGRECASPLGHYFEYRKVGGERDYSARYCKYCSQLEKSAQKENLDRAYNAVLDNAALSTHPPIFTPQSREQSTGRDCCEKCIMYDHHSPYCQWRDCPCHQTNQ